MYIRGLIAQNFTELAEAVQFDKHVQRYHVMSHFFHVIQCNESKMLGKIGIWHVS